MGWPILFMIPYRPSRPHGLPHDGRLSADGADGLRGRDGAGFLGRWIGARADSFEDYFRQLTEFEPKRAAQFGIQHYTWMAINPKETDDRELVA